jgi:hypothetical protein
MALQNQNQALDTVILRSEQFTFITPQQVKIVTGLAPNINDDNLVVPIVTAMNLRLKPILGVTLYNNLKQHYIDVNYNADALPDGSTLPDNINYKELYGELYNMLCWWSFVQSLLGIAVKIDEKGIMFNGSDYSVNAEMTGYNKVSDYNQKIAEMYTDQLVCYVRETITDKQLKAGVTESGTTQFATFFPNKRNSCGEC